MLKSCVLALIVFGGMASAQTSRLSADPAPVAFGGVTKENLGQDYWVTKVASSLAGEGAVADEPNRVQKTTQAQATPALTGDAKKGGRVFRQCKACHSRQEGKNLTGPTLYNVVGRQIGSVQGFRYSQALEQAQLTWTPENLALYLADPQGFLPGNRMSFRGLRKRADIDNLIAFLAGSR